MNIVGVPVTPRASAVGLALLDPFEGGRVVVVGAELVHVEAELLGVVEEQVLLRGVLVAPLGLALEEEVVHRLELALGAGGLRGTGGVDRAGVQRHVAHDEGDLVAVGVLQLLDGRVEGTAGLALEVEELDEGGVGAVAEALAVGADEQLVRSVAVSGRRARRRR